MAFEELKAYYTDDRVFENPEWDDLPDTGVLGFVLLIDSSTAPPWKKRVDGSDWYWIEDGMVVGGPTHDEWGKWVDPPEGVDDPKRGEAVSDDEWESVSSMMREDYR